MQGTATEVKICGRTVKIGDRLTVRYTTGREMNGGTIEGDVVELWSREKDDHLQGRLSCGWCFHDHDEIIFQERLEASDDCQKDKTMEISARRPEIQLRRTSMDNREMDKNDSVAVSIFAAEMVLENFERVYPDDDRPRKAIEAARNYLDSPTEKNRSAADSAARSAARSAEFAARSAALDKIETWLLNHIEQMEEWK